MSCSELQLSLGLSASLSFLSSLASNHHHDLAVLLHLSHRVLSLRVGKKFGFSKIFNRLDSKVWRESYSNGVASNSALVMLLML
nr:hypothetical protein CFP56_63806 [Quercus suber]